MVTLNINKLIPYRRSWGNANEVQMEGNLKTQELITGKRYTLVGEWLGLMAEGGLLC